MEKLYPSKKQGSGFAPLSMIDYYLAIASRLGCDTADRNLELIVEPKKLEDLRVKLPNVFNRRGPLVIVVPGGAFGPSKFWPAERFAQTAERLIDNYNATVVVSVSPAEKQTAKEICRSSGHTLINLAETPLGLGELKALFSIADLVISNDTGPRHIAVALGRKIISLFGPNNPAWTDSGFEGEIKIIGDAPCVPCDKPICAKDEHLCMESITVDMVCEAAARLLGNDRKSKSL